MICLGGTVGSEQDILFLGFLRDGWWLLYNQRFEHCPEYASRWQVNSVGEWILLPEDAVEMWNMCSAAPWLPGKRNVVNSEWGRHSSCWDRGRKGAWLVSQVKDRWWHDREVKQNLNPRNVYLEWGCQIRSRSIPLSSLTCLSSGFQEQGKFQYVTIFPTWLFALYI